MNEIIKLVLSLSVSGSLLAVVLFALKPLYKNRLRKTWQYYIWLVVLFRMILPFTPEISFIGLFTSSAPPAQQEAVIQSEATPSSTPIKTETLASPAAAATASTLSEDNALAVSGNTQAFWKPTVDFSVMLSHLWLVWLVTALVLLVWKIAQYRHYTNFIRAGSKVLTDSEMLSTYDSIRQKMKIKKRIPLTTNPYIRTPMLIGIWQPQIVLPESLFAQDECRMMLQHELTHYLRRDVLYKWFTQILVCMHWFNPLIYLVQKEVYKNCELACDEAVLNALNTHEKHGYGDALIASIKNGKDLSGAAVSLTMSEDGRNIKERLEFIMQYTNKPKMAKLASVAITLVLVIGAFFLGSYTGAQSVEAQPRDLVTEDITIATVNEPTAVADIASSTDTAIAADDTSFADMTAADNTTVTEEPIEDNGWSMDWDSWSDSWDSWNDNWDSWNDNWDSSWNSWDNTGITITDNHKASTDLDALKSLVYEKDVSVSSVYPDVESMHISTMGDTVKITQGEVFSISYTESFEGAYSLTEANGVLTLTQHSAPSYTNGKSSSDNWLDIYLKSMGRTRYHIVEIVIPPSMTSGTVSTMSGSVAIQDCELGKSFIVSTMSGSIHVLDSTGPQVLELDSMSGSIHVTGGSYAFLDTHSMSGSIHVNACAFERVKMDTMSGSGRLTLLDSLSHYNLSFDTMQGSLTHNGTRLSSGKNYKLHNDADAQIHLSGMTGSFKIYD